MRTKGFPLLATLVIITGASGCDNVAFGGIEVEVRTPSGGAHGGPRGGIAGSGADVPEALELGTVLYLVQRHDGGRASVLPVAEVDEAGYRALPDTEDLVERLPVGRWERGAELAVLDQGRRIGTFIHDGTVEPDLVTCQPRPRGGGTLELREDIVDDGWFLAFAKSAAPPFQPDPLAAHPGLVEDVALQQASVNLAQRLFPELGLSVPPSIEALRRQVRSFALGDDGHPGLAASFVYDDDLVVGVSTPLAYSVFVLAELDGEQYEPIVAWYQRSDGGGKAFPRFLGMHDLRGAGAPDALIEVFGEAEQWLAVLGWQDDGWALVYEDPCGLPIASEALRTFR